MNADKQGFKRVFSSPFMVEGIGVRDKSGFEQRGELLRAFQKVLQEQGNTL